MVLSVACVSAANAAVTFDGFSVGQTSADPAVAWASPAASQPIFGASGTRLAYTNRYSSVSSSVSVGSGTATFSNTGGSADMGLLYQGSAQDLTGYTFSFNLNMTGANTVFEVGFWNADGGYANYYVNYTTPGTYTIDLSTLPLIEGEPGSFDFTAITNFAIILQAPSAGSATVSNFTYTPAPGAIALLGAAGLVGARRRRD